MTDGGIKLGMTPPHPGAFIRIEALEELGLSVLAAARILGVRRATLSDLLNGNASLSPEMAMRVEKAFGLSMDLLLRMQAWHDVTQMRARADEIDIQRYHPPAESVPVSGQAPHSVGRPPDTAHSSREQNDTLSP